MACHLICAEPFSESVMICCQLDQLLSLVTELSVLRLLMSSSGLTKLG